MLDDLIVGLLILTLFCLGLCAADIVDNLMYRWELRRARKLMWGPAGMVDAEAARMFADLETWRAEINGEVGR